jgi:CBS domain containing-hemolysin-like protein
MKKTTLITVLLAILLAPSLANASFLPPDLIDGFANIISWVVLIVLPVAFIAGFWYVHILPDTIAKRREHPQRDAIHALCLLSLFVGGLLWPFAYLWAYTRPTMYKLAYGTDKYTSLDKEQQEEQTGAK